MSWYPQACPVCSGDLYDDVLEAGQVTCMMCARGFAAGDVLAVQRPAHRPNQLRLVDSSERPPVPDRIAS